ncbi:hypothetical protein EsDP_00002200 [Epichloe bromicola]
MAADPNNRNTTINDIVFPYQPSISTLLASLKRSTLSIHNRLTSILADAQFVQLAASSASLAPRPLVANERCGSWYVPPGLKRASAYFKSTDGHERAWKFSTRRLNVHLIELVQKHDGIIIVDSTRRGKRMPDALSTTIPIWCTVLNHLLLPSHPLSDQLFLPPHLLSTTRAQIEALIPSFVRSLTDLDLSPLPTLTKPLRPLWITRDSTLLPAAAPGEPVAPDQGIIFRDYRPVVCLTASRRVLGSEADSHDGYIQGAADDTENWACGLTPHVFWNHVDTLLSTADAHLPDLIASLLRDDEAERHRHDASSRRVPLTRQISVCALPLGAPESGTACCHVALADAPTHKDTWVRAPNHMHVGLGRHKTASRNLRLALPEVCAFVSNFLETGRGLGEERRVIVACESGRDTSVGTALALSCYLFDGEEQFRVPDENVFFTKSHVKAKLGRIVTAYPAGNPSRQTLQSVNSFLMDWARQKNAQGS